MISTVIEHMKPDRTRKSRSAKARTLARENGGAQISTLIGQDAAMRLAEIRRAESTTLRQAIESAILNYRNGDRNA